MRGEGGMAMRQRLLLILGMACLVAAPAGAQSAQAAIIRHHNDPRAQPENDSPVVTGTTFD